MFTKKEIQGWLKCMYDDTRPVLNGVAFQGGAVIITDGYIMLVYDIEWKKEYEGDEFGDYVVRADKLKEWCKNHTSKDIISVEELFAMADKQWGRFPNWKNLFEIPTNLDGSRKIDMLLVQKVSNVFVDKKMKMFVYGRLDPIKFVGDGCRVLIMPMATD